MMGHRVSHGHDETQTGWDIYRVEHRVSHGQGETQT